MNELKFGLELTWQGAAAQRGLLEFSKDWVEFRKQITGGQSDLAKWAGTAKSGSTQVQQLNRDVVLLHKDVTLLDRSLVESRTHLRGFAQENAGAARELSRVASETRSVDRELQKIEYHFHGAGNAAGRFRREADSLRRSMSDLQRLTMAAGGVGIGYGAFTQLRSSARLDQQMTSIMQTADATPAQRNALRPELFGLARKTGRSVEDISGVMDTLIQAGLSWDQARAATSATAPAMVVSRTPGASLAQALVTSSNLYGFDLAKPGVAASLLDQMRAAGKAGSAEMGKLPDILPRVAPNAILSGMNFKQTLGFIEVLSNIISEPSKLATLSESTLRVFSNKAYRDRITGVTGVSFFDKSGARRDTGDVMSDIINSASRMKTDRQRSDLMGVMFQGMDQDTIAGFSMLLRDPSKLQRMSSIRSSIDNSGGMIAREFPAAMRDAADQTDRLKNAFRELTDTISRPVNSKITDTINYAMNSKSEGGLGLSNWQMAGGLAATVIGGGLLARGTGRWMSRAFKGAAGLVGGAANTVAGIAEGKAIENFTGVTPVFVVNMPGGGMAGAVAGGIGDVIAGGAAAGTAAKVLKSFRMSSVLGFGLEGVAATNPMALLGPGAAFLGGYGAGSLIYKQIEETDFADKLGGVIAQALANLGDKTAQGAIDRRLDPPHRAELKIKVDSDGNARVTSAKSSSRYFDIDLGLGPILTPQ